MISELPPALTIVTYLALFSSVIALWFGTRWWITLFSIATVVGYAAGVLSGPAVLWIAVLAALCVVYSRSKALTRPWPRRVTRGIAALGICIFSLLLGMHALPGFHNLLVARDVVLSPGARPYTLYLNFDKTVAGLLILGICYGALMRSGAEWSRALKTAFPVIAATIAVVVICSLALGYIAWNPKVTALFGIWAAANLLFTCVSEEAFFRGFIQRELRERLERFGPGPIVATAVSAVLFGLAHFAGGWTYVLLATVAGFGYGLAYERTGRIEMAILAHFTLNATHFLLFTYPAVA